MAVRPTRPRGSREALTPNPAPRRHFPSVISYSCPNIPARLWNGVKLSLLEREQSRYLTVKDVLRRGLLKLDVPHEGDAVRLVRRVLVVVVGGDQQLGVLSEKRRSGDRERPGTAGNGREQSSLT